MPECDAVSLTPYGLVTPFGSIEGIIIDSGNGLLPDGTKPFPEPMMVYCELYR